MARARDTRTGSSGPACFAGETRHETGLCVYWCGTAAEERCSVNTSKGVRGQRSNDRTCESTR